MEKVDAQITRAGVFDIQVCAPKVWTDEEITTFAEQKHPCGTAAGWQIRRSGDPLLQGDPERQPCEERKGYIHVTLDA